MYADLERQLNNLRVQKEQLKAYEESKYRYDVAMKALTALKNEINTTYYQNKFSKRPQQMPTPYQMVTLDYYINQNGSRYPSKKQDFLRLLNEAYNAKKQLHECIPIPNISLQEVERMEMDLLLRFLSLDILDDKYELI